MNIPKDIINKIGEIQAITNPEEQGCTSQVAFIKTSERTYALKTSKDPLFRTWLKKESYILEHLKNMDLPTPTPFLFIEKGEASWLLMEKLPGRTLASTLSEEKDEQRRAKLISEFGAVVNQVHRTPAPAAMRTATQPWLESMLEEAQYNLDNYEVDGSQQLLDQLKATPPTPLEPALIHGDLTVDNVLTDGRQITGIIDWSGGAYGDPRYDTAIAVRSKQGIFRWPQDWHIFFEGYGKEPINRKEYDYFVEGLYEFF